MKSDLTERGINMFGLSAVKFLAPALIVGAVLYYIYSLKSAIEELEIANKDLSVQLLDSKANEKIKEASIKNLTNSIEKSNEAINNIKADNDKLVKELTVWKNKPQDIKYKTEYVEKIIRDDNGHGADGEACLQFMKSVSELKYEDL